MKSGSCLEALQPVELDSLRRFACLVHRSSSQRETQGTSYECSPRKVEKVLELKCSLNNLTTETLTSQRYQLFCKPLHLLSHSTPEASPALNPYPKGSIPTAEAVQSLLVGLLPCRGRILTKKRSGVGGFHTQSQTQAQKTKTHTHTHRQTDTNTDTQTLTSHRACITPSTNTPSPESWKSSWPVSSFARHVLCPESRLLHSKRLCRRFRVKDG